MLQFALIFLLPQIANLQWVVIYEGLFASNFVDSDLTNWSHKQECAMDKPSCGASSGQTITCNQNPQRLVTVKSGCRFTHLNMTTNIPHWQMKVIFDSYFISQLDKELEVSLGNYYSKEKVDPGKTPFDKDNCLSTANNGFGFNTSVITASHANNSVSFALCTQSDSSPSGVVVGFRNVQMLINQCHFSCKNCTGPNSNQCNSCYASAPSGGTCASCSSNSRYLNIGYSGGCIEECARSQVANAQNVCEDSGSINCSQLVINTLSSDFNDNVYSTFNSWSIIPDPSDVNTVARYVTCSDKYIGLFQKNEGVEKSFSIAATTRQIRIRAQLLLQSWDNQVRIIILVNNKLACSILQNAGTIGGTGCTVYFDTTITCTTSHKQIKVELLSYAGTSPTIIQFIGYMKLSPASKWGLRRVLIDQLACAKNCDACASVTTCQTCSATYFLHRGVCIASCPAHSVQSGQTCQDFVDQIPNSYYLVKAFHDTTQSEADADLSEVVGSCSNLASHQNKKSGQSFGHLYAKRVYGGPFSLHRALCVQSFNSLPAHHRITIKMKLIMGESQGDFSYQLAGGATVTLTGSSTPSVSENIAGKSTNEKVFLINELLVHTTNQLTVQIQYNSAASSAENGWGAISDYFILVHKCVPFCNACTSELAAGCTNWQTSFDASIVAVNPLQCQAQRYFDSNSLTCPLCANLCEVCTSIDSCSTCVANASQLDNECYCNDTFYKLNASTCSSCHSSCQTCFGSASSNCLSCSVASGRVLNINSCDCQSPLVEDGSGNCAGVCGDGVVQPGEQCDDGNTTEYDGCYQCSYQCIENCGTCTNGSCSQCSSGYGFNQANTLCLEVKCIPNCQTCNSGACEQCKDGYYFNFDYVFCVALCGDQLIAGEEQCDDGSIDPFDGCHNCQYSCNNFCKTCVQGFCFECLSGYRWDGARGCIPICGNGSLEHNEECDDGILDQNHGCYECKFSCQAECTLCHFGICYSCQLEGWQLGIFEGRCIPIFNDGLVVLDLEQCDDMNSIPFDGCTSLTWDCVENCDLCVKGECHACKLGLELQQGMCVELHGDGIIVGLEECDDSNYLQFDGCHQGRFQCALNCQVCEYGKCISCQEGFVKNILNQCLGFCEASKQTESSKCQYCQEECELCINGECVRCPHGLKMSVISGRCESDCGNSLIEFEEQCDDGNHILGDGCDFCVSYCVDGCSICQFGRCLECERGYQLDSKDQCYPVCGTVRQLEKECDDENDTPQDGCDRCRFQCQEVCQVCGRGRCLSCDGERGYYLDEIDGLCKPKCGDSILAMDESCEVTTGLQRCYVCQLECQEACQDCEYGLCRSCKSGFELDLNGLCVYSNHFQWSDFDEIRDFTNGLLYCLMPIYDQCYMCSEEDGYYLNEITGQCQKICVQLSGQEPDSCAISQQHKQIPNCMAQEKTLCRQCFEGYNLDQEANYCSAICGDGIIQDGEQCDDGTQEHGSGCYQCQFQCQDECSHCARGVCIHCHDIGWTMNLIDGRCTSVCGDMLVVGREQCDDGNLNDNDGCTNECQLSCQQACTLCQQAKCLECNTPGWRLEGSRCSEICGDGLVVGNEECEDLNQIGRDGCHNCSFQCQESCLKCKEGKCLSCQPGFQFQEYSCVPICGDMLIRGNEECDDGNEMPFDGCFECKYSCDKNCQICYAGTCMRCLSGWEADDFGHCSPLCGDGVVQLGLEICDDGNDIEFDGCHNCRHSCHHLCSLCEEAQCFACNTDGWYPLHHNCKTRCGDGIIAGNEICDDSNDIPFDGCFQCSFHCHQMCLQCKEGICIECENGLEEQGSQCVSRCGDGLWVPLEEQCDDGNLENLDGCSQLCALESGYFCFNEEKQASSCFIVAQPQMILTIVNQTYSLAAVELSFSEELIILPDTQFTLEDLSFGLLDVDAQLYTCLVEEIVAPTFNQPNNPKYQFTIHFLELIKRPNFWVQIRSGSLVSKNGVALISDTSTIRLESPRIISESEVQVAQTAQQFSIAVMITMLGLSTISIITGSFAILQNVLDQIQFLSYIKYINQDFPENLAIYFEAFKLVSLNPIIKWLKFDQLIEGFSGGDYPYIEPEKKFKVDEINAYFLPNIEGFLFCLSSGYLLFVLNHFLNQMISQVRPGKIIFQSNLIIKWFLKVKRYLLSSENQFHYSGVLRIFMANYHEICFALFLSLNHPQADTTIKSFSYYLSLLSLSLTIFGTFELMIQTQRVASKSTIKGSNLAAFYDGVEDEKQFWVLQFNSVLLIKKFSLIFFIVFLQQNGNTQSICVSLNSTLYLVYFYMMRPLTNKFEMVRIFITDFSISLNTILFLLYSRDRGLQLNYHTQVILGWVNISVFSFSLLASVILDIIEKIKSVMSYFKKNHQEKVDSTVIFY